MELTGLQADLFEFVKDHHGEQKRKYTNAPYWTHLLAVAELTNQYTSLPCAVEVGLCHDLFEDTKCNWDLLFEALEALGYSSWDATLIADSVHHLSDAYTKER